MNTAKSTQRHEEFLEALIAETNFQRERDRERERERERGKNSFEKSPWKLLSVGNLSIIIKNF